VAREKQLEVVTQLVRAIRRRMPRIGTRKLYHLLAPEFRAAGIKIGRDGLFNYLREQNLLITPRKRYTQTTFSNHWLHKHPNLLDGKQPSAAEQVLVSDITYLTSAEGTHYLSLVTDAYSRKIMGYKFSDDMQAESVGQALIMAAQRRQTTGEMIHHSDRGLQYCSSHYQQLLQTYQITPSMTDGYDCYQNALAERVNGILKQEFLFHQCATGADLKALVAESIHTYNEYRPHLSLQMQTPNEVHRKAEGETPLRLKNKPPKTVNLF
jgi:putative transposase